MKTKMIAIITVMALAFVGFAAFAADSSDAADPKTVTDGEGVSFEYTKPTDHIVTMGYASTLTVARLGAIDKIVGVDPYSTYDYTKDERLKELNATDLGSIYSASNNDKIVAQLLQWVEAGKFHTDDTVILTAYTNALVLRTLLTDAGFTHVLVYRTITDYDNVVKFVNDLSIIITGDTSKLVKDMEAVKDTVEDGLKSVTTKTKGLTVWYSAPSGAFSVGNTGSIAASLLESAGGDNIAYDSGKNSQYGDKNLIVQLLDDNDKDVVIFLSNVYLNDHTIDDFRNGVLGGDRSIKIVVLKPTWNNYCPDASEGLWAIASALYPDIFDAETQPEADDTPESGSDTYLIIGAIVVVIVVVASIAIYIRRP
ncbi:MAG: hypothetical protein LBM39_02335 [Candidatus Methanoplasma sp.]|jgi:ABC-type Fe3+-hydroxamate transport system substrate-binding protein|nr:hypothetical protein [Candidatus Methanoplasma sp.]